MKKAYTLVEILVVLIIVGAIAALGITAMTNFRRSIQLQQATSELLAIFKETETLAKNNNFPQAIAQNMSNDLTNLDYTYAYYLRFYSNGTNLTVARGIARRAASPATDWMMYNRSTATFSGNGEDLEPDLKSAILNRVDYKTTGVANGCNAVLFLNLTGDIKIMTSPNVFPVNKIFDESVNCNIAVQHKDESTAFKVLTVDPVNDIYKLNVGE